MKDDGTSQGEPAKTEIRHDTNPLHRILVVDDDIGIRQLSARLLAQFGFQVDVAEDGAAGWEALCAKPYDLLITDHSMPKLSGVELVKRLRSARMALPVILASGLMPTGELNRHPGLNLAATLPKPFTGDELLGTVTKIMRSKAS
jgi:DNA-binding response OmpR family regulator